MDGGRDSSDKSGCDDGAAGLEPHVHLYKKFVFIRHRYGTWIDDEIFLLLLVSCCVWVWWSLFHWVQCNL